MLIAKLHAHCYCKPLQALLILKIGKQYLFMIIFIIAAALIFLFSELAYSFAYAFHHFRYFSCTKEYQYSYCDDKNFGEAHGNKLN